MLPGISCGSEAAAGKLLPVSPGVQGIHSVRRPDLTCHCLPSGSGADGHPAGRQRCGTAGCVPEQPFHGGDHRPAAVPGAAMTLA